MTAHMACPWCKTAEHLSPMPAANVGSEEAFVIECASCSCKGPYGGWSKDRAECIRFAWARWDEMSGGKWDDYEEEA